MCVSSKRAPERSREIQRNLLDAQHLLYRCAKPLHQNSLVEGFFFTLNTKHVSTIITMKQLLDTRTDLTWLDAELSTWLTDTLDSNKRVSSVCGFITFGDKLVLVNHTTREWDLPGGHVESNETAQQAFFREIKEEANIHYTQIASPTLLGYFEMPQSIMLVLQTKITNSETTLKSNVTDEIVSADLFDINNLPQNAQQKIWAAYLPYLKTR